VRRSWAPGWVSWCGRALGAHTPGQGYGRAAWPICAVRPKGWPSVGRRVGRAGDVGDTPRGHGGAAGTPYGQWGDRGGPGRPACVISCVHPRPRRTKPGYGHGVCSGQARRWGCCETSKAWKRCLPSRSTPTAAEYCGASDAREWGAPRASAGGHESCRGVSPVASGVDQPFLSASKRCHVYAQARGPIGAGSPRMRLCRRLLPRDQLRKGLEDNSSNPLMCKYPLRDSNPRPSD
jgi:hypothetical protein